MPNKTTIAGIVLAVAVLAIAAFVFMGNAKAAEPSWSGCYGGVHAGYTAGNAELSEGGDEINLSILGSHIGVQAGCDRQLGRFVVGGFASYDWFNSDSDNSVGPVDIEIGLDNKWTLGARAGYLINPGVLAYAKVGYTEAETSGKDFDGVDLGGGLEIKLSDSVFLQADYTFTAWDSERLKGDEAIKVDPEMHTVRLGVVYRFGAGLLE